MPVVLHAVLCPGRGIRLWAESPENPARDGGGTTDGSLRPHPRALPAGELRSYLSAGTPDETVLRLPTGRRGPTPDDGVEPRPTRIAPWRVPTIAVTSIPRHDLAASPSVTLLAALHDLAADLVARGRVLPAAGPGDELHWRPVLQGPDLVAADALAAAMPPALRCAPDPGTGALPAAHDAATAILEAAVDRHARARLDGLDVPGWPSGLVGGDPTAGPRPDGLARGLGRWSVVGAVHAGPARGCFRLTEVVVDDLGHAVEESAFRLELALAATEDPSLVVPAATLLRDPAALRRWLDDPVGTLHAELDRAAGVWPGLAAALTARRPTHLDLDLDGAHAFLTGGAAALSRAGFAVELPASWAGDGRLGLVGIAREEQPVATTGVVARPSRVGRERLIDRSWLLAVDGEPLSDAELAALSRAKAPLVRRRGGWVALDAARLRAAIAYLEAHGQERVGVRDLLLGEASAPPLPVERLDAGGDVGALLDGVPERLAPLPVPAAVRVELRAYQRHGLAWLAALSAVGVGGVLADEMGLGKTLQLLALEAHDRSPDRAPVPPTLVVCPTTVITTWVREVERSVPSLRVGTHHGPRRATGGPDGVDLVVTSYETLARDVADLAARTWHRLVLDEAQMVKNPRSRAARAARLVRAWHRVAVTGTPMENRLAELWAVVDVAAPGLLEPLEEFRDRVAVPIERHGREDVAADLRARVRPVLLRRRKADVAADLPEKIETVERCGLTAEQASLYQAVVDELLGGIDPRPGPARRRRVLAAVTRLKQVCDHPALMLGDGSPLGQRSGKLRRVEELLADLLAEGERVLMFTQYAAFGHALAPHLRERLGSDVAWLHGGTPRRERDAMVERFGRDEGPPLFLLSLRAGGTGITLTGARHVLHLDRWWNPAVEDQATDRAHRIGQQRTVHVRRMVCAGTIEEHIDDVLADKRALADAALGAGPDGLDLAALPDDELAAAIALDPERTGDGR